MLWGARRVRQQDATFCQVRQRPALTPRGVGALVPMAARLPWKLQSVSASGLVPRRRSRGQTSFAPNLRLNHLPALSAAFHPELEPGSGPAGSLEGSNFEHFQLPAWPSHATISAEKVS